MYMYVDKLEEIHVCFQKFSRRFPSNSYKQCKFSCCLHSIDVTETEKSKKMFHQREAVSFTAPERSVPNVNIIFSRRFDF